MSWTTVDRLLALRTALRRELDRNLARDEAVGAELAHAAALVDAVEGAPEPQPPGEPGDALETAVALAERTAPDLAAALRPIAAGLPWRCGYAPRLDAPGLERGLRWAELIGPAAPWVSDSVSLGVLLMGPGLFYPPHRHPAVEVYKLLAGEAKWTVGSVSRRLGPGEAVLHRSGEAHAMRTGPLPFLAIYMWTGDVRTPSTWCDAAMGSQAETVKLKT